MSLIHCVLLLCADVVCKAQNLRTNYMFDGEKTFQNVAKAQNPVTDKVSSHSYQKMYGNILLPMIEKFDFVKKPLKFLEIGLGCGMYYGPGASVSVWKEVFSGRNVELWEAEYVDECVTKARGEGKLEGIKTVTGDQADPAVLKRWIEETGGKFDVIVDDGGHVNKQVLNSFVALWPELNPDGNYFIEDLEVAYHKVFIADGIPPVTKVIQAWVETLHVSTAASKEDHHKHILSLYPLPEGLDSIYCQKEACVLHKRAVGAIR